MDDSFGETQQSKETQGVAAAAATIVPAPQVSVTLQDAPQRDVSQFGGRMDPASFNITISYLRMTESSQAQFTLTCHALRGKDSNCRGELPLWSCPRAFHSRKSSTASQRRTIAASSTWLWASLRPMGTPSQAAPKCSY